MTPILKVGTAREKLSLQYNNDRKRNSELAVVTPAFVSDYSETLEEIAMEASHEFIEHGGESFMAIPCMNDGDEWCQTVGNWIED